MENWELKLDIRRHFNEGEQVVSFDTNEKMGRAVRIQKRTVVGNLIIVSIVTPRFFPWVCFDTSTGKFSPAFRYRAGMLQYLKDTYGLDLKKEGKK